MRPAPPRRRTLRALLYPDPPRRVAGGRALGIALRTLHLATFAVLVGGHVLGVDPARLSSWLAAAVVSGMALMALELVSTFAWLSEVKGVGVLLKLSLLLAVPLLWEQRAVILVAVVVVASISAHMPRRFRHHQLVPGLRRSDESLRKA